MIDPLSVNIQLDGVETTIPLLPEGQYLLQCTESKIEPNKDQNGLNWNLKLELAQQVEALDGRSVSPGFPLYSTCALQARPDSSDPEAFKRSIAETIDALFGTSKEDRPRFGMDLANAAVGRTCLGQTYIDEWPEGSGNKKNKIRRLKKAE